MALKANTQRVRESVAQAKPKTYGQADALKDLTTHFDPAKHSIQWLFDVIHYLIEEDRPIEKFLENIRITDLGKGTAPSKGKAQPVPKSATGRAPRGSKQPTANDYVALIEFLEAHPESNQGALLKGTGIEKERLTLARDRLRAIGVVSQEGKVRGATYSLEADNVAGYFREGDVDGAFMALAKDGFKGPTQRKKKKK